MEQIRTQFAEPQLFQQVFELSSVSTIITDMRQDDHPIVYANTAFERLTGYDAADILGHNCRFLHNTDTDQPGVREIQQAIEQEQSQTTTVRHYRKDGTSFYDEVTLSPLRDENGRVTHFVGCHHDVTAREEAVIQDAQARRQLHPVFEHLPDGPVAPDNRVNAATPHTPRPSAELTRRGLVTQLPEWAAAAISQAFPQVLQTGMSQTTASQLSARWVDVSVHPVEEGVPTFIHDVTEGDRAQDQVVRSDGNFQRVFQACPIPVIIARTGDQRFTDANPEFFQQSGYTREDIVGRTALDLNIWADPLELEEVRRLFQLQGEIHNREVQFRLKSGLVATAVVSIVPVMLNQELCAVTLIRDITTDEHVRQQFEASEERYRRSAAELQRILDQSLDMITTIDAHGHFVMMNAASRQILGYAPTAMIGRSFRDFVHPEDQARTLQEDVNITAGQLTTTFQNRYLHKNGAVVWLEWAAVMLPGDTLKYCVGRDITARRAAIEDQAYLAAIVQASQDAILGVTLDGTIRSWNAGAEKLYGYSSLEAVGQPITLIVPEELRADDDEIFSRAGRGEQPNPFESVRITKDNRRIPVLITVSPILDPAGQVVGVSKIGQDITERKVAEAEIGRLNEDLQQQLRYLTGVREIDQLIASSQDVSFTLDRILDNVKQGLGVDVATLLLLDPHTLNLEYVGVRGVTAPILGSALKLGSGLAGEVALSRQPLRIPDLQRVPLLPGWREVLTYEGLTAYYGAPLIAKGKVLGVIETLHRAPFEPSANWLETFDMLAGQAAIAVDNTRLLQDLEQRNLQLRLAYDETIEGWARALDLRDKETEGHSRRVTEMTVRLCQQLGLSSEDLVDVQRGALLHDIGKMGIPDAVLLKPGALTDEEWMLMKRHPEYAVNLLSPIRFLRPALDIPQYHHERWDGSGYPLGLSGEAIPLTARAFAVVDVYDALTSDRPYRAAWTRERALAHIEAAVGTHFDPMVVKVFRQLSAPESGTGPLS